MVDFKSRYAGCARALMAGRNVSAWFSPHLTRASSMANVLIVTTEQYDDAMFDFSRGEFDTAIVKLKAVLEREPENFDAQLALGMACYRKGDYASAIAEGHKAEKLRPREQLVHTNLSLFYMKAGDKARAEHHGLQAKIESWREDAQKNPDPAKAKVDPQLQMARQTPQPMKFPSQPWKKKPK
ncbi:MAG TPA: tetratricopeptide repeat protein [Verrucomicrobiae bacterium]|nr:tetratricopeptide repeat protein [Verrucomicrobiae bacterium]